MRVTVRSGLLALTTLTAAVLLLATAAWACVGLIAFNVVGSSQVEPGGTLEVFGGEFARGRPVSIHLDTVDGPVLATVEDPQPSTMTSRFTVDVPIPDDISPGEHLLVATQEHFDMNAGIPARAVFSVGGPVASAEVDQRPAAAAAGGGRSLASLVLIALVTAGAGVLLAVTLKSGSKTGPGADGVAAA